MSSPNAASSKRKRSPSPVVEIHKRQQLSDLFDDNLHEHTAQDEEVLVTLQSHFEYNDKSTWNLQAVVIVVLGTAKEAYPDAPLALPDLIGVMKIFRDETFTKIVRDCLERKSFQNIRNHRKPPTRTIYD